MLPAAQTNSTIKPPHWQHFGSCIVLHLILPLVPLLLERWFTGSVDPKSAVLTAALYAMAISLSSRNVVMFCAGILVGVIFAAAFGFLSKAPELASALLVAYIVIGSVAAVHLIERFNRHIIDKMPFFEFTI